MNFFTKLRMLLSSLYFLSSGGRFDYIFFSEKKNYKYYFLPLINKISSIKNNKIIYLSTDIGDRIDMPSVKNLYIGDGFLRMIALNLIKGKFFFITTTDLGNNEIKKSKNIDYYVYIFHSLQSIHKIYTEGAFNNYDIICCNGNYQLEELKKTEDVYNLKKKQFIKSGYLYLEYLKNNLNFHEKNDYVLFAPSWNYNEKNLFDTFALNFLDHLLKNNLKVIFRPHPEHYKRSKKIINKVEREYKNNKNFFLDSNISNLESLNNSNILITDFSGIAQEFLFVFKKPIIIVKDLEKIHNKNYKMIDDNTYEDEVYRKFGYFINSENFYNLSKEIGFAKLEFEDKKKYLEDFLNKSIFNNKSPSEIIYNELLKY